MTKISQIASALGLSTATVSRALSRPEMVAPRTRERVLSKAKEMGFSIVNSRVYLDNQNILGVIVSDLSNPFSAGVLKAVNQLATQDNMQILLGVTNESVQIESQILFDFNRYNLKGLIAMPVGPSDNLRIECQNIVAIDRPYIGRETKCALINNKRAVHIAYEHLRSKGHRHIVYLSGKSTIYTFRERLLAAASCEQVECIELDALEYNELYTKAFEIANILFSRYSNRPSAILASNNAIAAGVVYALSLRNMMMPRDIALVSIGDPDWCRFFPCPITTVKLPEEELGACAYRLMKAHDVQTVMVEPLLLPRSSS